MSAFPTYVRWGASRDISFGAAPVAYVIPTAGQVRMIRLIATENARIRIEVGAVVVATDTFLPAGLTEYVKVSPGDTVSVIQDSIAGILNITDCAN